MKKLHFSPLDGRQRRHLAVDEGSFLNDRLFLRSEGFAAGEEGEPGQDLVAAVVAAPDDVEPGRDARRRGAADAAHADIAGARRLDGALELLGGLALESLALHTSRVRPASSPPASQSEPQSNWNSPPATSRRLRLAVH